MGHQINSTSKAATLRRLLERPQGLVVPGVFDAITARLATKVGFEALYISGSGTSTALAGLPDISLVTLTEVALVTRYINQASPLPVVVDADTGFGGPLGTMRTVGELEAAGAAAIQLEDQVEPKRCGHLDGKRLVSADDMVAKVRAAAKARSDPNFIIIARTDARAVEGVGPMLDRAQRYLEAGADAIFPEALTTEEEFRAVAKALDAPLLANMTEFGKTPYFTAQDFFNWGYKMVLFPVSALRVANRAVLDFFQYLKDTGTQRDLLPQMMTRKELYEIIGYARYESLEREFSPQSDEALHG